MVLFTLVIFLLASVVLVLFGSLLVQSSLKVARFLRMEEFVAGFLVLAIATSIPELFIGIRAALAGNPALALGTVIGSNIANLALIGGIMVVMARGITITDPNLRKDILLMSFIAIIPLVLMFIGRQLSRFDGIILISLYAVYVIRLYFKRRKPVMMEDRVKRWQVVVHVLLLVAAIWALNFAAQAIVISGTELALNLALPAILVGLIFVALGTSLPELALSVRAVLEHHPKLAMGNIIGSVVANSLLVLGVTAVLMPITANLILFFTSSVFLIFLVIIFTMLALQGRGLSWQEGISLILFYVLFLIIELNIKEFLVV